MIKCYLAQSLVAGWRRLQKPEVLLMNAFLLLSALLYAWVFAEVLKVARISANLDISPDLLLQYLLWGIWILGLARMILPSYTPLRSLVPPYYPVGAFHRYLLSLLEGILQSYYLYLSLFVLTTSLLSPFIGPLFTLNALLTALLAAMVRRALQGLIDLRQNAYGALLSIGASLLSITLWLVFSGTMPGLLLVSLGLILLMGTAGVMVERQRIELKTGKRRKTLLPLAPALKQLFLHPRVRQPLMVSLLIKMFFLGIDYVHFRVEGEHLLGEDLSLWFLAAPLAIFSYLFNNSWGFWREVWLRTYLAHSGFLSLALFQLRMMAFPLLIDGILSISVLALYWENTSGIFAYYLTISVFYAGSAMFWSLRTPVRIRKAFQRKPTSGLSSFLTMIAAMMLTLMFLGNGVRYLIPLYLLAGGIFFLVARSFFPEWKYRVYQHIFKEK